MNSSSAPIPYDIFIPIIEELASQRCYDGLRACSQTCRILLHPCRVHLFSTIHIDDNAHKFAALLAGNSTIAKYVQHLTYQPTSLSEDIANALILLNNIQTFVFSHGDLHYPRGWDSLTPHIQRALIHIFTSPSITRISISRSSHFPAIFLSSCSNLKHLVIRHATSFRSDMCDMILNAHCGPPKLLSLDISRATMPMVDAQEWYPINKIRADGLPLLDLSGLQTLAFRMEGMQRVFLENILGACLKLKRLSISVIQDSIPDDMLQTITMVLPTLRSLKLEWWLHADLISSEFPEVIKALETLGRQPNCITELQLFMWIPGSHTWVDQDWEKIDRILVDRSNFRQLEKFDLRLWVLQGAFDHHKKQKQMAHFRTTKLPLLCLAADDYLDFNISYF